MRGWDYREGYAGHFRDRETGRGPSRDLGLSDVGRYDADSEVVCYLLGREVTEEYCDPPSTVAYDVFGTFVKTNLFRKYQIKSERVFKRFRSHLYSLGILVDFGKSIAIRKIEWSGELFRTAESEAIVERMRDFIGLFRKRRRRRRNAAYKPACFEWRLRICDAPIADVKDTVSIFLAKAAGIASSFQIRTQRNIGRKVEEI